MATPLNQRIRTDASADAGLQALLGTNPFRMWFDYLRQGSVMPAIVLQQISSNTDYSATQRIATGWSRQQFTVWGGQDMAGESARQAVASALKTFLDQWDGGLGPGGQTPYPNEVITERDFVFFQKTTPVYQRVIDVMMYTDERL
jgi:hypothetical protein